MFSGLDAYPTVLRDEVRHAARFAHTLATFTERLPEGDPDLVWLTGRADEVAAVAGAAVREWSEGRVDAESAGVAIAEYLDAMHLAVRRRFGRRVPACCGDADVDDHDSLSVTRRIEINPPPFQPRTDTIPAPPPPR